MKVEEAEWKKFVQSDLRRMNKDHDHNLLIKETGELYMRPREEDKPRETLPACRHSRSTSKNETQTLTCWGLRVEAECIHPILLIHL